MSHVSFWSILALALVLPQQKDPAGKPASQTVQELKKSYLELQELVGRSRRYEKQLAGKLPPEGRAKVMEQLTRVRAEAATRRGKLVAAIEAARKKHPRNPDILGYSCELAVSAGNRQRALADVTTIVAARPKDRKAANMRALLLFETGEFAGATREIRRIRKATGRQDLFPGLLIKSLANLHRWKQVQEEAREQIAVLKKETIKLGKEARTKQVQFLEELARAYRPYAEWWRQEQAVRERESRGGTNPLARIITNRGTILVELFEDQAPNTVANFVSLAGRRFYDGTAFHRVIHGFMAQGGDPNTKDSDPRNDGRGGPGYRIADECNYPGNRKHFVGSLAMAKENRPDTGGSQFYLTLDTTHHLNGRHTVFGRVLAGMDVLFTLRQGDRVKKVTVTRKRKHAYDVIKLR